MTALVTGASSGIGLQYATILARDYACDLLMVSNQKEELEESARKISLATLPGRRLPGKSMILRPAKASR